MVNWSQKKSLMTYQRLVFTVNNPHKWQNSNYQKLLSQITNLPSEFVLTSYWLGPLYFFIVKTKKKKKKVTNTEKVWNRSCPHNHKMTKSKKSQTLHSSQYSIVNTKPQPQTQTKWVYCPHIDTSTVNTRYTPVQ